MSFPSKMKAHPPTVRAWQEILGQAGGLGWTPGSSVLPCGSMSPYTSSLIGAALHNALHIICILSSTHHPKPSQHPLPVAVLHVFPPQVPHPHALPLVFSPQPPQTTRTPSQALTSLSGPRPSGVSSKSARKNAKFRSASLGPLGGPGNMREEGTPRPDPHQVAGPRPTPPWPARLWLWTLALFPNRFGNEVGSRAGSRYGRRHENSPGLGGRDLWASGGGTLKGVGRPLEATNFSALPPPPGFSAARAERGLPGQRGARDPRDLSPLQPLSSLLLPLCSSLIPSLRIPGLLPSGVSLPLAWPPSGSRLSQTLPPASQHHHQLGHASQDARAPSPWACIIHANPCFPLSCLLPRLLLLPTESSSSPPVPPMGLRLLGRASLPRHPAARWSPGS